MSTAYTPEAIAERKVAEDLLNARRALTRAHEYALQAGYGDQFMNALQATFKELEATQDMLK